MSKKNLKSPQWLRNLKFKQYPFWRLDKPKNLQIIKDGAGTLLIFKIQKIYRKN